MPRKRRQFGDNENTDRWLLTYADLITLLLAFFIVMYSMSRLDAKRFGQMAEALNGVLKGSDKVIARFEHDQFKQGHGVLKIGDLRMIQAQVERNFETLGRGEELQTEVTERGLVIHIMESALFGSGSSTLQPQAMEILDLVGEQIKDRPNHIRVEGHTDDHPIFTDRFPSNWELSTSRATSVVRYYIDYHDIDPTRVSALGYGEFRPIRPNNSPENRAKNRRVDIVLLTMDLTLTEPTGTLYDLADAEPAPEPSLE